ncbi:MAG: spore coat protein [Paeniclostridium sp.]|nr:spore coat protein [Paeniclostridium sp.]MBW4861211.1 spore coat protein [Paeniclostridium sp.]
MQLTPAELHSLHELILSCVNTITNMALYKNQITDPELKSMIENQFPVHIQDYNMKVRFIKESNAPSEKLNVPQLKINLQDFTSSPMETVPVTPRTNIQQLNDREIATGYLLTLKRAGREYAWSSMEATNPVLREFLKDAFTMACNHAYEVAQWLIQRGFYPLCPAPQTEINKVGSLYNEVQSSN